MEWQNEPNREEFTHAGMVCLLNRAPLGHWCGYVAVPPGHPAHGKGYDDVPVEVHGGLTYADKCDGPVCHEPKSGEPDNVWWLGFDCAHSFDVSPKMETDNPGFGLLTEFYDAIFQHDPKEHQPTRRTYKTIGYVRTETMQLAEQLAGMA